MFDLLEPGDTVGADRGFDIENILQGSTGLNIPPLLRTNLKTQFDEDEPEETCCLASLHVHVEQAMELRRRAPGACFFSRLMLQRNVKVTLRCITEQSTKSKGVFPLDEVVDDSGGTVYIILRQKHPDMYTQGLPRDAVNSLTDTEPLVSAFHPVSF